MVFNFWKFLSNIFRSAASKAWNNLSDELKGHALTAAGLTQVLKVSIDLGYDAFIAKAEEETGFQAVYIDQILKEIAADLGIKTTNIEAIYAAIQAKVAVINTDNGWNAFWQSAMKFISIYLSSGKLDWVTLSFGVAELAYEKLKKK